MDFLTASAILECAAVDLISGLPVLGNCGAGVYP